jgi:hypothetical protein
VRAGAVLLLLFAFACATGRAPAPVPAPPIPVWQIPADALGSQRLYRVSYSGPEGEGGFKVTLRLVSPERYQLQAADPVGRALWALDVADGRGLWLDHHDRTFCLFEGNFDVAGFPLGSFPLMSLPALLLGRVPAEPAGLVREQGRQVSFLDAAGRQWSVVVAAGRIDSWSAAAGEVPSVWWMRREGWAILSDRERGVQVRWREVLREALGKEPERLQAPGGYREESCREATVPEPAPG